MTAAGDRGFPYVVCGRPKPGEEPVRKEPAREHM